MKSFFLILGFFTRLPVPKIEFTEERYRKAVKLMPIVGLIIGVILALLQLLATLLAVSGIIQGAILLSVYLYLTGGLHFDGLADTCDGVFSGRDREQSLEIMKDSRVGVFGVIAIFITGLFYFAIFTEVHTAALLTFPIIGRACCLISASLAPYARESGMGKATSIEGGPKSLAAAVIFIAISMLLTILFTDLVFAEPFFCSLIASGAAAIITVCMTVGFRRKLGGVTGDTYGAVIEVSAVSYLFVFSVLYGAFQL